MMHQDRGMVPLTVALGTAVCHRASFVDKPGSWVGLCGSNVVIWKNELCEERKSFGSRRQEAKGGQQELNGGRRSPERMMAQAKNEDFVGGALIKSSGLQILKFVRV